MSPLKAAATLTLGVILLLSVFPGLVTADSPEEQFRERIDAAPDGRFLLGTDELGRNRLARLLTATRTSLLLAPAAAVASILVASVIGVSAGMLGPLTNRLFEAGADLTGSLPWLFVLIALRASLPLDAPANVTTAVTFAVLALLGWAGPARVVRNFAYNLREREFTLQAQALGVPRVRLAAVYILPHVLPLAVAQFLINTPVFILAEANLGLLGMGVSEPYTSLGNLLRELESYTAVTEKPWILAPALLLITIVIAMWIISEPERRA